MSAASADISGPRRSVPRRETALAGAAARTADARPADELGALQAVSRALAGRLESEHILAGALRVVAEVVGCDGSSVLLIEPETGAMRFYVAEGRGAEQARRVPVPSGAGICGHVAQTGQPLIVNDAQNDRRLYRAVDSATGVRTRNLLAVPIRAGTRLRGVLELVNKPAERGFTDADLRLAEVVATQTALALENADLHRQIVRDERMAAIGQTVSGLAHCIKNILNGVRAGTAIVDRALKTEDHDRFARGWQTVSRNNQMLETLVLDMLALARDSKPHAFLTDINGLVDQVCQLMDERAAAQHVRIERALADGLSEVLIDPTHVYRVVLNLVTNAVDACPAEGRVRVSTRRAVRRGRLTITVLDNGTGIPPENRRRLFTEFFTTKGGRGTGLGLPVTRKLVAELGGKIACHSVVGRGTRFVVALPLGTPTMQPQEIRE